MSIEGPPDFVIGAGAPAPPATPPRAGGSSAQSPAVWAAAIGLILGPPVLAFLVRWLTSQDHWAPLTGLWLAAIGLVLGAGWLIEMADQLERSFLKAPVHHPGEREAVAFRQALGLGLVVLAEAAAAASLEAWVGVAMIGLALAWVGFCAMSPDRHLESGFTLQVACSPEAAFAFISDRGNLYRFEPRETAMPPFPERDGLGAVHHMRVTNSEGAIIDADEVVTAYVPGRVLSHRVVGAPHANEGTYEFEPQNGGTRITYVYRGTRGVCQLIVGQGFNRVDVLGRLRDMQQERAERLEALLEAEGQASV